MQRCPEEYSFFFHWALESVQDGECDLLPVFQCNEGGGVGGRGMVGRVGVGGGETFPSHRGREVFGVGGPRKLNKLRAAAMALGELKSPTWALSMGADEHGLLKGSPMFVNKVVKEGLHLKVMGLVGANELKLLVEKATKGLNLQIQSH